MPNDPATLVAVHDHRLTAVEQKVDDLDAKMDKVLQILAEQKGARRGAWAVAAGVATVVSFVFTAVIAWFKGH